MVRYYGDKKNTVEDCRSISVSFLRKHDFFCGLRAGTLTWMNSYGERTASIGISVSTLDHEDYVQFRYSITDLDTGEKSSYDYKVQLATTPCNLGGVRWWFICPLTTNGVCCGRRVGKLYLPLGGKYYGCRHCYELSYESRNETRLGRWGKVGYMLKLDRQIEGLQEKMHRWLYKGRPTKKALRLHALERRMAAYDSVDWERLLKY